MKKTFQIVLCALGGGMIGFFANRLDTVFGCVGFTLGVTILVSSIIIISRKDV